MLILLAYLTRRWLAVSAVIILLLTVMLLLLTLAEAASEVAAGRLPPGLFWWQLLLSMPEAMGIVVPLAVIAGLILSIGQAALDREWVVMRSSGLALGQLFRAVALMGGVAAFLMLAVSGYLQPWSLRTQTELKEEAARSAQLWGMQPGRFVEIPGLNGVAYVATLGDDGFELNELFLVLQKDGHEEVLTATQGEYQQSDQGERYIRLHEGQRIEIPQEGLAIRNALFASGVLQIPQENREAAERGAARLDLHELISTPEAQAQTELHWRLAAPIAVFVLSLYGLICAAWGQGEGRAWRVILGIVVYVAYVQLMNLARVRIDAELWSSASLYWIHLVFLISALLLMRRLSRRF